MLLVRSRCRTEVMTVGSLALACSYLAMADVEADSAEEAGETYHDSVESFFFDLVILARELHGKIKDEARLENILSAFPMKVENTLRYYRVSLVGRTGPKRRRYNHRLFED